MALPLALPMGWVESPPYFTAATVTAYDLINTALQRGVRFPSHPLESLAATPPTNLKASLDARARSLAAVPGSAATRSPPLAYSDVYVDDFILAAQTRRHRQRVLRAALHSIDQVFRPLPADDASCRKEPISVKKLKQGDASWSTRKTILGWDFDTKSETLTLPPHRLDRLYELLNSFTPTRKRAPISEWRRLGELRSMAAALPGARGLFSVLRDALSTGNRHRVRLSSRLPSHRRHPASAPRTVPRARPLWPTSCRGRVRRLPAWHGRHLVCSRPTTHCLAQPISLSSAPGIGHQH